MRRRTALLTLPFLALLPFIAEAQSLSDFAYVVPVAITNTSGATLTVAPVAVPMNMDNLVTGGFLQADAEDLRPVDASQTAQAAVAQSMTANNVTLWQEVASLANNSGTTYQLNMGDPTATRTQAFAAYGTDGMSTSHNAAFNITDLLNAKATLTRWDGWKSITTTDLVANWEVTECVGPNPVTLSDWKGGFTASVFGGSNAQNSLSTARAAYASHFCSLTNDGATDRAWQVADNAALRPASITVEFWVYLDGAPGGELHLVEKRGTVSPNVQYAVGISSASKVILRYTETGPSENVFTATTALSTGQWYHVAVAYTFGIAGSAKVYLDGVDDGGSWTTGSGTAAKIGENGVFQLEQSGWVAYPTQLNGSITDVRLWNVIRTQPQIAANNQRFAANRVVPLLVHRGQATAANYNAGQLGYALYLEYDAGCASTLARIKGSIDTAGLNACMPAIGGGSDIISLEYTNPNATLKVDGSTIAGPTNLGVGAIATGTAPLRFNNAMAGLVTDTNLLSNSVAVAHYRYQPDELTEATKGEAANGWNWLGIVDDQSGNNLDAAYDLYRDQTGISVSVGAIQIKAIDVSINTVPTANVVGNPNVTPEGLEPTKYFPGKEYAPTKEEVGVGNDTTLWFFPIFLVSVALGLGGFMSVAGLGLTTAAKLLGGVLATSVWWASWRMGLEPWWVPFLMTMIIMGITTAMVVRE